jgi:hypothetical protein
MCFCTSNKKMKEDYMKNKLTDSSVTSMHCFEIFLKSLVSSRRISDHPNKYIDNQSNEVHVTQESTLCCDDMLNATSIEKRFFMKNKKTRNNTQTVQEIFQLGGDNND